MALRNRALPQGIAAQTTRAIGVRIANRDTSGVVRALQRHVLSTGRAEDTALHTGVEAADRAQRRTVRELDLLLAGPRASRPIRDVWRARRRSVVPRNARIIRCASHRIRTYPIVGAWRQDAQVALAQRADGAAGGRGLDAFLRAEDPARGRHTPLIEEGARARALGAVEEPWTLCLPRVETSVRRIGAVATLAGVTDEDHLGAAPNPDHQCGSG